MKNLSNILTIARREFVVRARTRSFRLGTVVLVGGVLVFAFLPLIGQYLDRGSTRQFGLYSAAPDVAASASATVTAVLNSSAGGGQSGSTTVVAVASPDDLIAGVRQGTYSAGLVIARGASGDLGFTYYSNENAVSVQTQLRAAVVLQAAQSIAIADRLERVGVTPAQQATFFAPVSFSSESADPSKPVINGNSYLLGFGVTILIFLMVVLYGTWVAMSVVEEKSSRVMEVVLNAATPFQLLGGKVVGVGALALVQYLAIVVAGGVALVAEGPLGSAVLGQGSSSISIPEGLNAGILLLLGIYGALGFAFYSILYAAAASLISRQEDVQQAVMPMTLVMTAGYMVGVYGATGMLDVRSPLLTVLAQVPFFSPFMMLPRVTAGQAAFWEVPLSIALLLVAIVVALWVAARIYAAGVLMYGQRPSLIGIWRVLRAGN